MRDLIYRLLFGYNHIIIAEYRENEVESEIAHTSSFYTNTAVWKPSGPHRGVFYHYFIICSFG